MTSYYIQCRVEWCNITLTCRVTVQLFYETWNPTTEKTLGRKNYIIVKACGCAHKCNKSKECNHRSHVMILNVNACDNKFRSNQKKKKKRFVNPKKKKKTNNRSKV